MFYKFPLGNVYDIYEQDIPEMDMYAYLRRWKTFLESYIGRKLEDEDYLFPDLGRNGVIRTSRPFHPCLLYSARVQEHINSTRHTLFAAEERETIGKRWSLNRIRWWGGWAVGEHVRKNNLTQSIKLILI